MANSQFSSPAILQPDGTIQVTGGLEVDPSAAASDVEVRFLLVQGDVVVEGAGRGQGEGEGTIWVGATTPGQEPLQPGAVLAIGLAILARKAGPRGFETFTWSKQIDLQ